jgi:hypothetical protein
MTQNIISATVVGRPRIVTTKYSNRAVLDARAYDGQTFAIWGRETDSDILNRCDGERVGIALDQKGKPKLVAHAGTGCVAAPDKQPMGFKVTLPSEDSVPETTCSAEIADYIQRLGKLYGHCLATAAAIPQASALATPEVKDVATTFFIQAVQHFNL